MTRLFPRISSSHQISFTRCMIALVVLVIGIGWSTNVLAAGLPHRDPEQVGLDGSHLQRIHAIVAEAIDEKKLPGCVVMIGRRNTIAFAKAYGNRRLLPSPEPMTTDTVFDLASLTKPMATATSVMILVDRGLVRLRDPVKEYLPQFGTNGKEAITVEQLLTHQGGLIPDNPVDDYRMGNEESWRRINALGLEQPVGEQFVYTDVGFLVLGHLIEKVTGQSAAEFSAANIFEPLGMNETGYLPSEALRARAATTEQRDGRWLRGVVHDPRAALLGGVAGHAGLFSTAEDMALYANMMLARGQAGSTRILSPLAFEQMIRPRNIAGQLRGLGWDSLSKYSSNRGELFTPQAFGHGGFTGTAMWIDPTLDLFVIFLSNRVHPTGDGSVNRLAGRIGTIAAAAIREENRYADVHPTRNRGTLLGIDVLEQDQFSLLKGQRVGLITNHTGCNRNGKRTVDLLHESINVDLVALFSPEHGLQGKLDKKIADSRDASTGLTVHSLYGETRKPRHELLKDIDTLVFDIQDIGTRFYTYISTMGLAMEAAAESNCRFIVLDRPNPLGGEQVAGPMLDRGSESFVGFHPLPVQHGMTIGELAQMIRAERKLQLDLEIVTMQYWRRSDRWDLTGLTWINPSPNMRSLTQAMLYPGIGLLEKTNLSVGRGTETPFEVLGAPWIDGRQLAAHLRKQDLPGVTFVPIKFTPDASKFAGQFCSGVNLVITNRDDFQSVQTGIAVACSIRKCYPQQWEAQKYDHLLGNQVVFQALLDGKSKSEIKALYKPSLKRFLSRRREYLLYP